MHYVTPSNDAASLRMDILQGPNYTYEQPSPFKDTRKVEEHGVTCELLSPSLLVAQVGSQSTDKGPGEKETTDVYLCYHWGRKLPFVIVKHELEHKQKFYSPQYGRDDNYVERVWRETLYQIYSLKELEHTQPNIAQFVAGVQ